MSARKHVSKRAQKKEQLTASSNLHYCLQNVLVTNPHLFYRKQHIKCIIFYYYYKQDIIITEQQLQNHNKCFLHATMFVSMEVT